jgi:uncharacterized lipoprotein YajG
MSRHSTLTVLAVAAGLTLAACSNPPAATTVPPAATTAAAATPTMVEYQPSSGTFDWSVS